jgi:hypothetical protein
LIPPLPAAHLALEPGVIPIISRIITQIQGRCYLEISFVGALVQLQLGAGIIRQFFEKGKTQDIESRAHKECAGH